MGSVCRWRRGISLVLVLGAATTYAAGRNDTLTTAELLVDLARDHGLNCRGKQTPADAEQIRTLLRAAIRLDPRMTAAYGWLYELAALRGDEREAEEMITALVAADRSNAGAYARWLEAGLGAKQTVEQRVEWLRGLLEDQARPADVRSMIHVHLVRLALARLNRAEADAHLAKAIALDPGNPEALALQLELLSTDAPVAVRLEAALRFLEASPFHVDAAWQVALILDGMGLHADADRLFQHAREIHERVSGDAPVPGAYRLQLARHYVALGQLDQAAEELEAAITSDSKVSAEGAIFYYWILSQQGRQMEAERARRQLARHFAGMREPAQWPINELAQGAWYYCTLDPQPQRALMLAEAVAARAPEDVFVRRVLGWAQVANFQTVDAIQTLLPIAGEDPYAAYQLAVFALERDDQAAAKRIIQDLEFVPPPGPARARLEELGFNTPTSPPSPQVAVALASFNLAVLEFHRDPSRFLEAKVEPLGRSPAAGQPWRVEFSLTNRANFPITLGSDAMVNPVFLVSFELEGDRRREFPNLLSVPIDRVRVLAPGATVSVRRTVDVGPVRRVSRRTPQRAQRVTLNVLLDPLQVAGAADSWQPSLGGQALRPMYLNRVPITARREALRALLQALSGESDRARFLAVEQLAELLGEKQRADLGRVTYQPEPIPVRRVQQALVSALGAESWELRVRTLDAIQLIGFDARTLSAVEACLDHPHWLVRLMAVRLLGERQGRPAGARLGKLAQGDEDGLVRDMAASYLGAWESAPAASQPAGGE